MDLRVGLYRRLSTKELILLNCGVGEDSWESLGLQGVHPKGDRSWIFIGRTGAEAETPIVWPPDRKNWLTEEDPDAGKDWRLEGMGTTENEMIGWLHWLNGHKFEQAPGIGDVQGSLVCCSSWGRRVRHDWATELNWTELTLERCYWDYLKYTLLAFPPVCLDHSSARLNLHNLFD